MSARFARLRHDWPVRWAHHPLCARHRHETWRIGRLHLCRGCVALYLGIGFGGASIPLLEPTSCALLVALLAPPVVAASWPPFYARLRRALRDVLRGGAGLMLALAAAVVWHFPTLAWPLPLLLFVAWRYFARARRRLAARACDGCPELGAGKVCSGYAQHAAAMRAYEAQLERELATVLEGSGDLPDLRALLASREHPSPPAL